MRLFAPRLATTMALLAAAAAWASPAEAQLAALRPAGANALRAPVAPALLADARRAGATRPQPAFLLEVRRDWSVDPTPVVGSAVGTGFELPDFTAGLRHRPGSMPVPVDLVRRLPLSFGVENVLDDLIGKRALERVIPGLKSASRVFRLGASIRF